MEQSVERQEKTRIYQKTIQKINELCKPDFWHKCVKKSFPHPCPILGKKAVENMDKVVNNPIFQG